VLLTPACGAPHGSVQAATMAFECGICASMFNSGTRIPLILECGHTFCQGCVQTNLGAQRCCPFCRQLISKHVDDLPRCASGPARITPCVSQVGSPGSSSGRSRARSARTRAEVVLTARCVRTCCMSCTMQELRAGERHGGSQPATGGAHGQVGGSSSSSRGRLIHTDSAGHALHACQAAWQTLSA
jgi:hypothetical protein